VATAKDVAKWLAEQVADGQLMYQETVVYEIAEKFGDGFTYANDNGNMAIDKHVLKEFNKLTADTVVWLRSDRAWRMREDHDKPGRQQES
jgi:hypothetical protein